MSFQHFQTSADLLIGRLITSVCAGICFWAAAHAQEPVPLLSSNLPIIIIDTGGREIQDTVKISANMRIIDNGGKRRNSITDSNCRYDGAIGIEYRGSSSTQFPKKQFAVETRDADGANLDVSLLGMPPENDWVLYAPFSDKSLMRNVLAYKLSSDFGHYAARTRFCELVFNGRYWGVYVLMEKIKRDKNRVNIAKLDANDESWPAISGGYILKIDKLAGENNGGWQSKTAPWFDGALGVKPMYLYHYPKPDEITAQQAAYIQGVIADFESMMSSPDYDTADGMWAALDMESVIDYCILNELSKNIDGYRLSAFLYKDRDDRDPRLHVGPVWDYNIAFGNANHNGGDRIDGWMIEFLLNDARFNGNDKVNLIPFWWGKIWYSPRFQNRLYRRWQELRQGPLSLENLERFIDETARTLGEAQQRNFRCWPILGKWVWPNAFVGQDYAQEVDYLKQWLEQRVRWLDDHVRFDPAGVDAEESTTGDIKLGGIYPNPFNGAMMIAFDAAEETWVELTIYNLKGQKVATLMDETAAAGEHRVPFVAEGLAAGIYFCRLRTSFITLTQKMVLQK